MTKGGQRESLLRLLHDVGATKCVWLDVTGNFVNIITRSSGYHTPVLDSSSQATRLDHIRTWLATEHLQHDLIIDKIHYVSLLQNSESLGSISLIIAEGPVANLDSIRMVAQAGYAIFQRERLIASLENTLLANTKGDMVTPLNHLGFEQLPPEFVADAVPGVIMTTANEAIGPFYVAADPETLMDPKHLALVVNIYSSLDGSLIDEIGHLFTIQPADDPKRGEIFNIVFAVANPEARGNVEIHAISCLIGEEFLNLSQSIFVAIKSVLFSGAESIRTKFDTVKWNLHRIDLFSMSTPLKLDIYQFLLPLMKELRMSIAVALAQALPEETVLNWQS